MATGPARVRFAPGSQRGSRVTSGSYAPRMIAPSSASPNQPRTVSPAWRTWSLSAARSVRNTAAAPAIPSPAALIAAAAAFMSRLSEIVVRCVEEDRRVCSSRVVYWRSAQPPPWVP